MTARRRVAALSSVVAGALVFATLVFVTPAQTDLVPSGPRQAYVFLVHGPTLGDLFTSEDVRALARAGGAGWMSPQLDVRELIDHLSPGTDPDLMVRDLSHASSVSWKRVGDAVRVQVPSTPGVRVLVIVVASRSASALEAKDDLHAVIVADASANRLYRQQAPPGTITSDSTRRTGIVASSDVEATVDAFLGRSSADDAGHVIRLVDGPPPFGLHDRYLAMRRMTVPVQTAAGLYVTIAGLFGLIVLWLGRRASAVLGVIASGTAISVGPLAAALLAAGHLPTLSYATVVPFVAVVTAILVVLVLLGATRELLHPVLPLAVALLAFLFVENLLGWTAALTPFLGGSELDGGRFFGLPNVFIGLLLGATRELLHPVLPLAVALLAFLFLENLLGWTAALTPFLGGSELDGGRFFGLPNVFIGLLLGASLYAASRLSAATGFVVLVAAGLFAGLPFAGANLGGAVTLFAAAGLWLPLRARGRLGWRELAFAAGIVIAGTAIVLVAHRLSPLPTHVTRFEQTEGAGGAWSTFVDRLAVGWRLIVRNPFALVPVVGVLAMVAVMLRPSAIVAVSLERHPAWRDALLVLSIANVVAYIVNDSGPAACGVGFGMALGGLLYVSVAERTWKMAPA